ncbi:MAG: flagellar basal body L-ring protein FlgH [Woeseiaceae bacterium]
MTQTHRLISIVLMGVFVNAISGCGYLPKPKETFDPPAPISVTHAPPTDGAIYRANTDVRLFEDLKASRVGDILTVRLDEQTNASKASQTSTSKSTEATLANPTVLGRPLTHKGDPIFGGSLSGENTFDGSGASSQSNSLVGDITVTVVERLANGNLRIRGEKWVTLNQGREFIQLSGTIRPNDIETDNTLLSTRIANAQITYSSKGVLAAANKMGFVSRFFNSVLNPY